jgi:hypothetical protein
MPYRRRGEHHRRHRMMTWYAQRFITATKHPMGQEFRRLLDQAAAEMRRQKGDDTERSGDAGGLSNEPGTD